MSRLLFAISMCLLATNIQCAKVLALFPVPGRSLFNIFQPFLEKLAERGHEVDVFSHFPVENPVPGYTDLSVKDSVNLVVKFDANRVSTISTLQMLNAVYNSCAHRLCIPTGNTTIAKDLMKSKKKYDVIVTQLHFSDCFLGYAHIFKAPLIGVIATVNLPWASELIGLPDNPSYIPNSFSSYTENMSFLQRLQNVANLWMVKLWYFRYALEESNKFSKHIFGNNMVHLKELVTNYSLVLVNSHFSIHQSRPVTPNFIEVAGIHIKPNNTLPRHLEAYMKTDLKGIIFLSFGTYLNSDTFSEDKLRALFEALKEVPYKIIWKGDKSNIPNYIPIPSNVYFVPWMPQIALLCHPNLKAFITHCGLSSIQESIYCAKPMMGIPIWVDQNANANLIRSKQIGVTLSFLDLTKGNLSNALNELLNNPKYTSNVKKLSSIFKDRPISAMDTAVFWTEYVIRHKGAPHLKSKSADLPWYLYYCIDIAALFISTFVLLLAFVLKLYKTFRCRMCRKAKLA